MSYVKFIQPTATLMWPEELANALKKIELIGRVAYKSEDKITEETTVPFVKMLMKRGHLSVIEHSSATVHFVCDRGLSHELVRHRLAAVTQESTRYVNYGKKEYVECCFPYDIDAGNPTLAETYAEGSIVEAVEDYLEAVKVQGVPPQIARYMLPHAVKTELYMTANFREWLHILNLRSSPGAHPEMIKMIEKLIPQFQKAVPVIFDDLPFHKQL